jgi:hypothetical protein
MLKGVLVKKSTRNCRQVSVDRFCYAEEGQLLVMTITLSCYLYLLPICRLSASTNSSSSSSRPSSCHIPSSFLFLSIILHLASSHLISTPFCHFEPFCLLSIHPRQAALLLSRTHSPCVVCVYCALFKPHLGIGF